MLLKKNCGPCLPLGFAIPFVDDATALNNGNVKKTILYFISAK
jgi:hypothetical protein